MRSSCETRSGHRSASRVGVLLALAAAAVALALVASACGGEKKAATTQATQPTETTAPAEGAEGHLTDAKEAVEKGKLKGPESAEDHLEEALSVSGDLPKVKEHAEEALAAVKKGDKDAATEHIDEAMDAAMEAPAGKPTATVKVSLGEWFVKPDKPSVAAGSIEFEVTNDGTVEHEFVVVKTDAAPDKLPVKGGKVDEEKAGESPGEIEDLAPGKTESATMKLEPGKYVLICNLPGHYSNGQRVAFTVT